MKKILLSFGTLALALAVVPMFAAFEAHVINVTATIENALSVPVDPIQFGTVFPQEKLNKSLAVNLSGSFLAEGRVDDVEYIIRQKPKCAWSWQDQGAVWHIDEASTASGHVTVDTATGATKIDCGEPARPDNLPTNATWGVLPSLCEYISKHPDGKDDDGQTSLNDGSLNSFHKPYQSIMNASSSYELVWTDTKGRLAKSDNDRKDLWTIDLAVPCFGGYCAQDWVSFVKGVNPNADPAQFTQPIENEHKVFGCDLWVEVTGVSEAPPRP